MHCRNVESRLSEYLDEFLSPRFREEIEAHLTRCPACQRLAHEVRRVREAMDGLSAVEPPQGLASRIDRIPWEVSQDTARVPLTTVRVGWFAAAVATAALVLVIRPAVVGKGSSGAAGPMAQRETSTAAVVEVRQLMLPEERQGSSDPDWVRVSMSRGVPLEGPRTPEATTPAKLNEELIWQEVRRVSACSRRSF